MSLHEHMNLLEDLKREAWARTSPVAGQMNAWEFRKDCLGNLVRYADFGKRHSPFGWELDFIAPRHLGGNTDPDNLRVLHWRASLAKGDNLPAGLIADGEAAVAAKAA